MSTDTDLEIPPSVEVRRRAGLAVALGAGASLVAIAYLARAVSHGGVLDWVLFVVLGAIGVVNLAALLDARTPLLVADDLGVRLRLGRSWVGLPWGGLHEVEHRPQRGWWRDGLLVVRPHYVATRDRGPRPCRPAYRSAQPPAPRRAARRTPGPRHASPRRARPDRGPGRPRRRPDARRRVAGRRRSVVETNMPVDETAGRRDAGRRDCRSTRPRSTRRRSRSRAP